MFIDRGHYLEKLNHLYEQPGFHCVNLYADQGMGKTTFLRELVKGKKTLYFRAQNTTEKENFLALKAESLRVLGQEDKLIKAGRFSELLRAVGMASKKEPLLFIIDDFPHLIQKNRRLSTLFHSYGEKDKAEFLVLFVLCKPERRYCKEINQVSYPVCLRPFSFFQMKELNTGLSPIEQVSLYGVTGGIPGYIRYFQNSSSFEETLYQLYFQENGILYRLPALTLQSKAPEPESAHSALLCLGAKRRKLHEICDRTDMTPSAAGSLMNSLGHAGITEKIIPVTEDQGSRRTLYRISNPVFRFWYTFVAGHTSDIELGKGRQVFENIVLPRLDEYFRDTFEDICRQFLEKLKMAGKSPFSYSAVGSWWGQHPTKKRTEYVPIAAADDNNILLGDCFWTDEWIDLDGLQELQRHAGLFPHSSKWYTLFAKSDFVSGMETIYGDTVKVFTLAEMCSFPG